MKLISTELITLLHSNGYMPVDNQPCDLILMDINLPGDSGFTRCRKLRETSNTPVIFLTARDTPEDELLAFGVGGNDFIRKPYNSAVLLARIARILKTTVNDSPTVRGLTLDLPGMKAIYGGSTGMGLYIVSRLCQSMNIQMEINSKEGQFTRFFFRFPAPTLQNC